jgi:hypothetical protein
MGKLQLGAARSDDHDGRARYRRECWPLDLDPVHESAR